MVADCVPVVVGLVQLTFAVRKPASVVAGEVTWKVALILALEANEPAKVFEVLAVFLTTMVQPLRCAILNLTPFADAPVVFVKVKVTSCTDLGVNVVIRDMPTC